MALVDSIACETVYTKVGRCTFESLSSSTIHHCSVLDSRRSPFFHWSCNSTRQSNGDELSKCRPNGPRALADICGITIITFARLGQWSEWHKPKLHIVHPTAEQSSHRALQQFGGPHILQPHPFTLNHRSPPRGSHRRRARPWASVRASVVTHTRRTA